MKEKFDLCTEEVFVSDKPEGWNLLVERSNVTISKDEEIGVSYRVL